MTSDTTATLTKSSLLLSGTSNATVWCDFNGITMPPISEIPSNEWRFDVCAYYRPTRIYICVAKCASPGTAGRNYSWPGYAVDRTPYGVIAHELGHHVDYTRSENKGSYFGDFSVKLRRDSGEAALTGYAPNDAEWFAEMFRLFVTNPALLFQIRPRTYILMTEAGLYSNKPNTDWLDILEHHAAPERIIKAASNRVK